MITIKEYAADAVRAIERADLTVTRAIKHHRHDPKVKRAGAASEVADQPPLVALSVVVLAGGLALRHRPTALAGARMLAAHALATGIKTAIKRSVDRTRPDHAIDKGYRMESGDSEAHELSSFPSGHTAGAVAVAQAVAHAAPALGTPARLFATAIALIQVPRCKHYVSDVVVGATIGWAGEAIAGRAIDHVLQRYSR